MTCITDRRAIPLAARTNAIAINFTAQTEPLFSTFAQQRAYVERFATALARPAAFGFGFKPVSNGTVVAVFAPNHVLYPTALWGILRAGGIATTVNATYTVPELVHQLKDSGASILVAHSALFPIAIAAAKESGLPESAVILFEHAEQMKQFPCIDDLLAAGEKAPSLPKLALAPGESAKRPAFICYSSGTTGLAKGTLISHDNIKWNVTQFLGFEKGAGFVPGVDKLIGILPLSHVYALVLLAHIATYTKVTTVMLPRFDLPVFLNTIDKYRITKLHLVPPIIIALAKHPLVDNYSLATADDIISGAAPLGKEISEQLEERLIKLRRKHGVPGKPVMRQGFGLTETATVVCVNPSGKVKGGAVGELLPNIDIRLVDPETGRDAAPGAEGGEKTAYESNFLHSFRD